MVDIAAIQSALREFGFDAWLLGDFRGSNVLARRILGIPDDQMGSRRWHYLIPAQGEPQKLVHRIEPGMLDHLPGAKTIYLKWQEWDAGVTKLAATAKRVAMEYSPRNANPYVSRVDAGTLEVVRATGAEVLSSGNLIQRFEATWDDEQWQMHLEAAQHTDSAFDRAWKFIASEVRTKGSVLETKVQQLIMNHFAEHGLTTYHPPIVGANAHSGDPHFETCSATDVAITNGDFVLIDLWAKMNRPRAVYSDLTRVGFVGEQVPAKYEQVFQIVSAGRDAAIAKVRDAFAKQEPLAGWQVDDAARQVITAAGYGPQFVHRLGHSIGQEVHGNGANMDNLETREDRLVLPRCCFSIEPGIYLPEFGIRSEVDVFVGPDSQVHVTGGELQTSVVPILKYS
ncbi:Xaa-Pro dipeptidase [Anatilimnocola aggregata]|uniref:Xaa-Pro dipeptidase n=1 Tax=Anatilimnocola aggregata TaxID=2528021 RepID=A0A517YG13_9BACT|nr:M24 family metallopeptidase [Anatilimnocola aggregata]QDU29159.1 Xaa-Pro dipeptidase [Anatilimnocola aggregata]